MYLINPLVVAVEKINFFLKRPDLWIKELVKKTYISKKIIHFSIINYNIDDQNYRNEVNNDLYGKSIILEIKFICLPIKNYNQIINIFKNNNLNVTDFFCSSYVRSFFYLNSFNEFKELFFLDIGLKRSTLLRYDGKILATLTCIPVGGSHITKDISKVMEITLEDSEKITLECEPEPNITIFFFI